MTSRIVLLVGVLATVVVAACAEASSEATIEDGSHERLVPPEMVRAAEDVLAETEESDDGWTTGVVLAEQGENYEVVWSILTTDGVIGVDVSMNCDDNRITRDMWVLVDPGDLVSFDNEDGDQRVCSDEFAILRKAAA